MKCSECTTTVMVADQNKDALHDLGWTKALGGLGWHNASPGWRCRDCTHRQPNGKHLVFVYGILKTPDAASDPPDVVEGKLYCSGIALARFDEPGIIRGQIREIDDETLRTWDTIECVDQGMYSRIRITTIDGRDCWAYQYEQSLKNSHIIENGIWTRGLPC